MSVLRALVVDDEAPARSRLTGLLADVADMTVIGECSNGVDAVRDILASHPDIVFLDVQMPELSGFDVVELVGAGTVPALVFVTAYDAFALQAFEARAIDYLLKPFTSARFDAALDRARTLARGTTESRGDYARQIASLRPRSDARIAVRDGDRTVFLRIREIDYASGAGNYVRIHAGATSYTLRATLKQTAARLEGAGFARVSHSSIVNLDRIIAATRLPNGNFSLQLETGTVIETSPSYGFSPADAM